MALRADYFIFALIAYFSAAGFEKLEPPRIMGWIFRQRALRSTAPHGRENGWNSTRS
jgi:hypothetical protein